MNNLFDLHSVNSAPSVSSVLKDPASNPPTRDHLLETLDQLERQTEHAQTMAHDSPNIFLKAAINIAAMDFFTILNRFDTVTLSERLQEKPELYFQLINCQANLMRANLEREKFEFKQKQAEARRRDREQKLHSRKPVLLTDTTLEIFGRVAAVTPASQKSSLEPRTANDLSSTTDSARTVHLEFVVSPSFQAIELTPETPAFEPEIVPVATEPYDAPAKDLLCSIA